MKPLFSSSLLQKQFEENGFVKIPLLDQAEAAALMTAYEGVAEAHERINIPYITTSHSNDSALIHQVDMILQKALGPAIDRYLINYNLLFGNYLVKMPQEGSETSPHQDITFVDESQYASVNIWVALEDINEANGCMYFLPGSHMLIPTLRPTHDYPWAYEKVADEIKRKSVYFTAKAGEAFIFNHAVVHGSYANSTDKPRIAAVLAAYHKEAELLHFYLPEGERSIVQKYSMTKEAFLHFVKGSPPLKGVFVDNIEYDFRQLSAEEFKVLLKSKEAKV
jgi:hypothetical protein